MNRSNDNKEFPTACNDFEFYQRPELQAKILEYMNEGVLVCNDKGIIVYTNSAFDHMFGYDRGELLGEHVNILNNKTVEDNAILHEQLVSQLKRHKYWNGELENIKKDGNVFITLARMSTLETSTSINWISVQQDITEMKKNQMELALKARELDNAFAKFASSILYD